MSELSFNDQIQLRKEEIEELISMGIEPFPSKAYPTTHSIKDLFHITEDQFESNEISIAGRVMHKRIMGKASFAELQDFDGKIQLYLKDGLVFDENGNGFYHVFKKLVSLGDVLGIKGTLFYTKTKELSVRVSKLSILSKSVRPLPVVKEKDGIVYDEFSDKELRYRRRYVDLIVNSKSKQTFIQRSKIVQSMRSFLLASNYYEVETPILQPIYGGAYAKPFITHHNALDQKFYLRIANELYLKRLIIGGFSGVFEFAKDFRNEGMSRYHNPEFTQMELYVAYKDYSWMMDYVESMIERVCLDVYNDTKVEVGENILEFKKPWKRIGYFDAIEEFTGTNIKDFSENELINFCYEKELSLDNVPKDKASIIDHILGEFVEPNLIQPTILKDFPIEMSPLAKKHRTDPSLAERFEIICNGKEIANAYSELNDPFDQEARLLDQVKVRSTGNEEAMMFDSDFIRALEYGMPPTSGFGIGIDRLAMILTNSNSIQDVILFPHLKNEKSNVNYSKVELLLADIPTMMYALFVKCGYFDINDFIDGDVGEIHGKFEKVIHSSKTFANYDLPIKDTIMKWQKNLSDLKNSYN